MTGLRAETTTTMPRWFTPACNTVFNRQTGQCFNRVALTQSWRRVPFTDGARLPGAERTKQKHMEIKTNIPKIQSAAAGTAALQIRCFFAPVPPSCQNKLESSSIRHLILYRDKSSD